MKRSLTLFAAWLLLATSGCMKPIIADVDDHDGGEAVLPDPLRDDSLPSGSSVAFSMDAEQFGAIAAWLGHENTLTIEKAVHVEQQNVTLDAKAGTRFSYTMADDSGKFTFERPFPTVKAGFATKLIGGVALHDVTLNADGSGVAATGLGRYPFRWMNGGEDDGSGVAAVDAKLPEVWAFSCRDSCPLSVKKEAEQAKKEFAEAKDLPFRVVWKDAWEPCVAGRPPAFWFHTSADQPRCDDAQNTRTQNGWKGLKHFTETWKYNRDSKRFIRNASAGTRPFVQPDRSEIGSRSVAIWTINGDSTPSRGVLLSHLTNDGIHRGMHDRQMLESLTTEQLRWLHDHDHNER